MEGGMGSEHKTRNVKHKEACLTFFVIGLRLWAVSLVPDHFDERAVPVAPLEYSTGRRTEAIEYARQWERMPYQPVAVVVFLHIVTLSLYSVFWFSSMHDRLPRTKADDPSARKAIWLLFLPVYD